MIIIVTNFLRKMCKLLKKYVSIKKLIRNIKKIMTILIQ